MRYDNKVAHISAAGHEFVQMAKALAAGRGRAAEVQKWAEVRHVELGSAMF